MFLSSKRASCLGDPPKNLPFIGILPSFTNLAPQSPAKKVKLSENGCPASSEPSIESADPKGPDQNQTGTLVNVHQKQPQAESAIDLTSRFEETQTKDNIRSEIVTSVETPPPTPHSRVESQYEIVRNTMEKLKLEIKSKAEEIENISIKISEVRAATGEIKRLSYRYDNMNQIVNRGLTEVRDLLNQIYNPGQKLAEQAETLMLELKMKQDRKFERISLDLNCRIEEALSAIQQKKEALRHEIGLHERTLMHQNMENNSKVEKPHIVECEVSSNQDRCEATGPQPSNGGGEIILDTSQSANPDGNDTEDCIILDQEGAEMTKTVDSPSNDISRSCDDEDTDIDDNLDGDSRPFTPCQAQRPDI